jgi:hypothetical protein
LFLNIKKRLIDRVFEILSISKLVKKLGFLKNQDAWAAKTGMTPFRFLGTFSRR